MNTYDELTDGLDADASDLARQVLDSDMDERSARFHLLSSVRRAGIAKQAATHTCGSDHFDLITNMVDRLDDILLRKIVGDHEHDPTYDLRRCAEGDSLCGWARNFALTSARYLLMEMRRERSDLGYANDAVDIAAWGYGTRVGTPAHVDPEGALDTPADDEHDAALDLQDQIIAEYERRTHRRPRMIVEHEQARAVSRAIGTPAPGRAPDDQREAIVALIRDRNTSVREALAKLAARRDPRRDPNNPNTSASSAHPRMAEAVDGLSVAFGAHSLHDLEALLRLSSGEALRVVVASTVADRMAPPSWAIDDVVATVTSMLADARGLRRAARPLVESFVVAHNECLPGSSGGSTVREIGEGEKRAARATFTTFARRIATLGTSLGDSVEAVTATIDTMLDEATSRDLEEHNTASAA